MQLHQFCLQYVPLVVEICTTIVEGRGLENQGIYRVPGNTGAVNFLQNELDRVGPLVPFLLQLDGRPQW